MSRHFALTVLFTIFCMSQPLFAQQHPFSPGDALPELVMTAPQDQTHRAYLGLAPDAATFTLADISADAVLVQIFSMYCPICQKEAPKVNVLYDLIASRGLQERVKILGIGAGNSDLEVKVFNDKYDVVFPLISDPDYVLHKLFQGVGTPYFVLAGQIKSAPNELFTTHMSHLGSFDEPQDFLDALINSLAPVPMEDL